MERKGFIGGSDCVKIMQGLVRTMADQDWSF